MWYEGSKSVLGIAQRLRSWIWNINQNRGDRKGIYWSSLRAASVESYLCWYMQGCRKGWNYQRRPGQSERERLSMQATHRWMRAKLEKLNEMGARKLHAILRLITDLTGWPQDSSEKSFHHFSSCLGSNTISSTKDDILRGHLRSIPDQQGLWWIWSWISHTQQPLSYEELAMALCYRDYW